MGRLADIWNKEECARQGGKAKVERRASECRGPEGDFLRQPKLETNRTPGASSPTKDDMLSSSGTPEIGKNSEADSKKGQIPLTGAPHSPEKKDSRKKKPQGQHSHHEEKLSQYLTDACHHMRPVFSMNEPFWSTVHRFAASEDSANPTSFVLSPCRSQAIALRALTSDDFRLTMRCESRRDAQRQRVIAGLDLLNFPSVVLDSIQAQCSSSSPNNRNNLPSSLSPSSKNTKTSSPMNDVGGGTLTAPRRLSVTIGGGHSPQRSSGTDLKSPTRAVTSMISSSSPSKFPPIAGGGETYGTVIQPTIASQHQQLLPVLMSTALTQTGGVGGTVPPPPPEYTDTLRPLSRRRDTGIECAYREMRTASLDRSRLVISPTSRGLIPAPESPSYKMLVRSLPSFDSVKSAVNSGHFKSSGDAARTEGSGVVGGQAKPLSMSSTTTEIQAVFDKEMLGDEHIRGEIARFEDRHSCLAK